MYDLATVLGVLGWWWRGGDCDRERFSNFSRLLGDEGGLGRQFQRQVIL